MAKKLQRKLTDQEWLFCYELVHRGDMIRAFKIAYPRCATRPPARIMWLARRVRNRKLVDAEVRQIQADLRSTQRLTVDQHLTILADLRDEARSAEQFAAAIRAEELRGRAAGFYFEQHVHYNEGTVSRPEIEARLAAILAENPRLKELLDLRRQAALPVSVPAVAIDVDGGSEASPVIAEALPMVRE